MKQDEYSSGRLIIAFCALLAPLLLFCFRSLDDNRLTSWHWLLSGPNVPRLFLVLCGAVFVAFVLSPLSFKRRKPAFLLSFSFLCGALFWGEPEVIVDAARYFTQAKQLAVSGIGYFFSQWGREIFAWTDLPLIPFMYGLVFKFFGESRLGIQLLTTLFFSSTVLLTYYLGKLLWDEETGFLGALLLLAFPYLYTQVPLLLVDVPTMFFLLLAVYLFTLALRRGGASRILLSGTAVFLVFFAKFSVWVFFAGFGVIFLTHVFARFLPVSRRCAGTALWAGMLIGLAIYLKQDVFFQQIRFLIEYQKPGLGRWGEGYLSTFLFQIHIFVTAAALSSIYYAVRKKDYSFLNIACFVLFIFFLHLQRIRYSLPLFPFIALMAAYGIREIGDCRTRRFFVFCAVFSALVLALFFYLPFLKTMSVINIKDAGLFLNTVGAEEVEVILLAHEDDIVNPEVSIPLLDYYADGAIIYEETLPRPDMDKYLRSSLRFTWEYEPPSLYRRQRNGTQATARPDALVFISNRSLPAQLTPFSERLSAYTHSRSFSRSTGIFLYRTYVTVFFN
jgi:hypothetical protein